MPRRTSSPAQCRHWRCRSSSWRVASTRTPTRSSPRRSPTDALRGRSTSRPGPPLADEDERAGCGCHPAKHDPPEPADAPAAARPVVVVLRQGRLRGARADGAVARLRIHAGRRPAAGLTGCLGLAGRLRLRPWRVARSGTVTFLFSDIEGSTTLLKRIGDAGYAELLATHRRLMRETF